jgi:hypothetical protein
VARPFSASVQRGASRTALAVALAGACLLAITGTVWGAFSSEAANHGNEIVAAPDFVAPTASQAVVQKTQGGVPGFVRPGGTFHVYGNVSDTGNPASGVASVQSDVSELVLNGSAIALTAGSHTVAGQPYNYRSASLTVRSPLGNGAYNYSFALADAAGNTRTQTGFGVTVDGTAPAAADVQTQNKTGGTAGRAEIGDAMTLTFNEPIDPNSISSGWTGAAPLSVVARLNNNVTSHGGQDTVTIYNAANTVLLPLGTARLGRNDYVSANRTFGATGTASTLTQSGNGYVLTLGTASGTTNTVLLNLGTMSWYPASGATDRAGNAMGTTAIDESGSDDREF